MTTTPFAGFPQETFHYKVLASLYSWLIQGLG
jgi:hypothetical protein